MPRRIHGVRLAITSTARSVRCIVARGPGVGADASCASADPARVPWRSTARSCQLPGTPRNSTLPRSSKLVPEPTTRSRTVRETTMSPAPAWPSIRAAICTASPPMSAPSSSHSPVWIPARISIPNVSASARRASAQRIACVGPSNVARCPSPVLLHHRAAESLRKFGGDLTKTHQHRPPPLIARCRGVLRRSHDVGEQHGAQRPM